MQKRALAFLMVIAMLVSFLPVTTVLAEEAAPGYKMITQKAHNQTEGSLAIDIYLQATTAGQADVTGYQFTATPATGLTITDAADATGNDGLTANDTTFIYDPTTAAAIPVGTSRVLVATITVTGETLPEQAAEAITLADATVTTGEVDANGDAIGNYTPTLETIAFNCDHESCGHGTGTWTPLTAEVLEAGALATGSYYLTGDVTLTKEITFQQDATVTICLNGFSIDGATNAKKIFHIGVTGVTLNVCDCTAAEGETYTAGSLITGPKWGGAFCTDNKVGATINVYDAIIDGTNSAIGEAAMAYIHGGCTLNMYGGLVKSYEGYTSGSIFYGAVLLRGTEDGGLATGYFSNVIFEDCGTAIFDSTNGGGEATGYAADNSAVLTVKDVEIRDSREGAHAIDVKQANFNSVTIEGNCHFDAPVYVAANEKPITLNLGSNASPVHILSETTETEESFHNLVDIPEGVALPANTLVYDNEGCYVAYADGVFSFNSSHSHDGVTFNVWTDPTSLPTEDNYYLDCNVTVSEETKIALGHTLNLDLNGKTITATDCRAFNVAGTLNLYDCSEKYNSNNEYIGGKIVGGYGSTGGAVLVQRGENTNKIRPTFNMYGGRITGCESPNGGAVYVVSSIARTSGTTTTYYPGGIFNMYGGELYDNTGTTYGGAVTVYGFATTAGTPGAPAEEAMGAQFNMYGGLICDNTSGNTAAGKGNGGGVFARNDAIVNIYGGQFTGNSAFMGGAIYGEAGATVTIEDAIFANNEASDDQATSTNHGGTGGAIHLNGSDTSLTATDSSFTGNSAQRPNAGSSYAGIGGAIYSFSAQVTLTRCDISRNAAAVHGGAIVARGDDGSLTIIDSTIKENQTLASGGVGSAIYALNEQKITLDGTAISGNTCTGTSGAVYVTSASTRLILSGDTVVSGNINSKTADGGNNQQDIIFQGSTAFTQLLEVDELTDGAHVNLYYYNGDSTVTSEDTADGFVRLSDDDGTQSTWSCGWISVFTAADDTGRNVSYMDTDDNGTKEFVFGHWHEIGGALVEFTALSAATTVSEGTQYYYLSDNMSGQIAVSGGTLHLCFNGKTVSPATGGRGILLTGGIANIYDCTAARDADGAYISGGITGTMKAGYGGAVRVEGGTSAAPIQLNWYGGSIYDCKGYYASSSSGAVMFTANSTYANIHWVDGAIHDNYAYDDGNTCNGMIRFQGSGINVTIDNMDYYENHNETANIGGIVYAATGNGITVNGGNYYNNSAGTFGGVFHCNKKLTINDGKFYGNSALRGGVVYTTSSVDIKGGEFYNNTVGAAEGTAAGDITGYGAVVFNNSSGTINVTGGSFHDNTAYGYAGVIYNSASNGKVTVTGTAESPVNFTDNNSYSIAVTTTDDQGTATTATSLGFSGAIEIMNGTLTATGATFTGNYAEVDGGAVRLGGGTGSTQAMTLTNCTFDGNSAESHGGAIWINNTAATQTTPGKAEITGCNFYQNQAATGGALAARLGDVDIATTKFEGNSATEHGGAIWGSNASANVVDMDITDSWFLVNSADKQGGAISARYAMDLYVSGTEFNGNTASTGAGICTTESAVVLDVDDCEFTGNVTSNHGGAIRADWYKTVDITGSTFYDNESAAYGGALYFRGNSAAVANVDGCTFEENSAETAGAICAATDGTNTPTINISEATITGNYAGGISGIGVYNTAVVTVSDSVIEGNTSEIYGAVGVATSLATLKLEGVMSIRNNASVNPNFGADLYFQNYKRNIEDAEGNVTGTEIINAMVDVSGLTEGSIIGVYMDFEERYANDPVFTTNGGAAKRDYFFSSKPECLQLTTRTVDGSSELCFVRFIDTDGTEYDTIQAYIDAKEDDGATAVAIPACTPEDLEVTTALTVDMNGMEVASITVPDESTLTLIDSKTNDYTSENAGSVTVTGNYNFYAEDSSNGLKRYVVIANEDGSVSAHRVYLAITAKVLRPTNNGVGFKAIFAGSDVIAENQDNFGIQISLNADFSLPEYGMFAQMDAGIEGTTTPNQKTIVIRDIIEVGAEDNAERAITTIYGRPYFAFGDQVVYGNAVSTCLNDLAEAGLASSDAVVKAAVQQMLDEVGLEIQ